jgi:hypothetical protein
MNLLNRWLFKPRDDGKPRVLIFPPASMAYYSPSSKVLHFIDNSIKVVIQFVINVINLLILLFPIGVFQGQKSLQLFHPAFCTHQAEMAGHLYGKWRNKREIGDQKNGIA